MGVYPAALDSGQRGARYGYLRRSALVRVVRGLDGESGGAASYNPESEGLDGRRFIFTNRTPHLSSGPVLLAISKS